MINIVIGLIFILLLLSLLATTIMELINSILSSRGKHLEKVLENMLAPSNNRVIFEAFRANPLYRQLSGRFVGKNTPPSYLTSENFRDILFKVLGKDNQLENGVEEIPDQTLKEVLHQFLGEANFDYEAFAEKVESWYNNVMDRASGWFRRKVQGRLIIVGLVIAVLFNADTIAIYNKLSLESETLDQVVLLAQEFVEREGQTPTVSNPKLNQVREDLLDYANQEVSYLKDPLGLGWDNFDTSQADWYDWMKKILGWLVTALAISLGAPFWFDLLKKFVNIKAAGKEGNPAVNLPGEAALRRSKPVSGTPGRSVTIKSTSEMKEEARSSDTRSTPVG